METTFRLEDFLSETQLSRLERNRAIERDAREMLANGVKPCHLARRLSEKHGMSWMQARRIIKERLCL